MVAGSWFNQDGLYIQYGTQKAVPEMGGEYLAYGETRAVETYVCIASTTFGNPVSGANVSVGALPSSFVGNSTAPGAALSAGIQTLNTYLPLQTIAPILTATAGQGLLLNQEQMWLDRVDWEVLVTANTGNTTTAAGLTGIGLVGVVNQQMTAATSVTSVPVFVQITPNAGTQLLGGTSTGTLTAGFKWTYYPAGSAGTAMTVVPTSSAPAGGVWGGNWPLVTNAQTNPTWTSPQNPSGLIPWAYISSLASTGQFLGSTASGLAKIRIFWNKYGTINQ
jgi:hypothetical protein